MIFSLAVWLNLALLVSASSTATTASSSASAKASSSASVQTSSSAAAKSTSTAPAVGTKSKRGLAFAAGDTPGDIINANQTKSDISWQYNWANLPPAYLATSNIKYIPMQWGSGLIDQFADAVKAQGADTILGFNEPDFVNESNMNATDAAHLWMQFIQPLKEQGIRLGGPAVTASPTGRPWLVEFFNACTNCTIDFLPLHWYGSGTEGFYSYLWDVHGQFPNMPIWITEYAETSTNDTVVLDFLNQTTTYLDTLDWIEHYAWFGFFVSYLLYAYRAFILNCSPTAPTPGYSLQ
ncbi:glycosyl hydrolase catalytic core-domain-containing protein [Crucibulum laeve]|uniref:Glycosyl hydrolase catalytic core-domain-containing protein n=1 Tax=Crucibulum laeve TaxID=68775 RepID=A0A5C3MB88_9AGAR|nr:glycosyl hydrolase catalytic core-domain-containing protein [Crucibulum laeve]